jgi:TPR repeat protein
MTARTLFVGWDEQTRKTALGCPKVIKGATRMAFTDAEIQEAIAAAQAGGSDDLYKLGLIYSTGQGGPVDYVQAHMWFNLAAMKGSQPAKESRKELSAQMSPCEIAAAQKSAREWLDRRH